MDIRVQEGLQTHAKVTSISAIGIDKKMGATPLHTERMTAHATIKF